MSLPVLVIDLAEDPSMAMKIAELGVLKIFIEVWISYISQELVSLFCCGIPQTFRCGTLRVSLTSVVIFLFRGILLLFGIHLVAIHLVVPSRISKIAGDHVCAWMDMANHALA